VSECAPRVFRRDLDKQLGELFNGGPEFARRDNDDRCGLAFDVGLDVFRPTDSNENHFGLLEVFKVGETTWPGSSTIAIDDQ